MIECIGLSARSEFISVFFEKLLNAIAILANNFLKILGDFIGATLVNPVKIFNIELDLSISWREQGHTIITTLSLALAFGSVTIS